MQVRVDADRCQGHALCAMTAPDVFDVSDDDGHAFALASEVPAELQDDARGARDGCPEQAVIVED